MTKPKHLPECFNGRQRSHGLPCICARLRACEARVRADADDVRVTEHADHITWEWRGNTGVALVQREVLETLLAKCNEPTYAAGLDAAREAVLNAPRYGCTESGEPLMELREVLDAIDDLREEKK